MNSDRKAIRRDLKKYVCLHCGLVRSGENMGGQDLQKYYTHDYKLNLRPEHYFYTHEGPISRSKILCDWISTMGIQVWNKASHCLEVGAGAGMLLQEFVHRFPGIVFDGTEFSTEATVLAQKRGLSVHQGGLKDLGDRKFDIIYSIGVIEHVPSPSEFLKEIHKHLVPGGWLFLCQPTQDVQSYDLFFFDHLHHFGTEHLRQYAVKCGFRERNLVVGHKWIPNFSLHLWQATEPQECFRWVGHPGYTTCKSTAQTIVSDMARLDRMLVDFEAKNKRVAIFGPGEVYWLAFAYSKLGNFPVVCGLDDRPNNPEFARLKFPVVVPEESLSLGIQDVILTMNKVYYDQAHSRLRRLGMVTHELFT